jgi:hypothetical protein
MGQFSVEKPVAPGSVLSGNQHSRPPHTSRWTADAVQDRIRDIRRGTFMSPRLLIAVLIGGMVAGILDIGAAAAINRKGPVAILHVIASGLLGPKALKGGSLTSA